MGEVGRRARHARARKRDRSCPALPTLHARIPVTASVLTEPPAPLAGAIENAPLPAGIGREIGPQLGPTRLDAGRQQHVGELLVNPVVADADAEPQRLRRPAVDSTIERHASDKCAAERNRQHEDEPTRRNRPDGRPRLAEERHATDLEGIPRGPGLGIAPSRTRSTTWTGERSAGAHAPLATPAARATTAKNSRPVVVESALPGRCHRPCRAAAGIGGAIVPIRHLASPR